MLDTFRTSRSEISAWYWDDPEHEKSKFHIKSIVVDGRKLYIGSANLSETAMKYSAECGLFVTDPNASKQLENYSELLINSGLLREVRWLNAHIAIPCTKGWSWKVLYWIVFTKIAWNYSGFLMAILFLYLTLLKDLNR